MENRKCGAGQTGQKLQQTMSTVPGTPTVAVLGGSAVGGNEGGVIGSSGGVVTNQMVPPLTYQSASVLSSDLDSTSLFGTESEITLDRDMTECSSIQRLQVRRKPQRRRKRAPSMSRTSSYSSITDSTMSLNIITVSINMEAVNFLGISIVGQSNRGGDGGEFYTNRPTQNLRLSFGYAITIDLMKFIQKIIIYCTEVWFCS